MCVLLELRLFAQRRQEASKEPLRRRPAKGGPDHSTRRVTHSRKSPALSRGVSFAARFHHRPIVFDDSGRSVRKREHHRFRAIGRFHSAFARLFLRFDLNLPARIVPVAYAGELADCDLVGESADITRFESHPEPPEEFLLGVRELRAVAARFSDVDELDGKSLIAQMKSEIVAN